MIKTGFWTLRKKTLLIIGLTMLALIVGLLLASNRILLGSFEEVEQANVIRDVDRVEDALSGELESLESYGKAYSEWTDTQQFIARGSGKTVEQNAADPYIVSNFTDATFVSENVNLYAIFNLSSQLVWGMAYDVEEETPLPLSDTFLDYFRPGGGLASEGEEVVTGYLLIDDTIVLITVQPIFDSDGEGESAGTFVTARNLDEAFVENLSDKTHISVSILPYGSRDPEVIDLEKRITAHTLVEPIDNELIAGYRVLNALDTEPILILEAEVPREVYERGVQTRRFQLISLLAIGGLFTLLALFLLERLILSRLSHLTSHVQKISESGNLEARVVVEGKDDELAALGSMMNAMLNKLQVADEALRDEKRSVERKVIERTADLQKAKDEIEQLYAHDKEVRALKDRFVTIASHELRTPLTHIKYGLEMLGDKSKGSEAAEYIAQGTQRLDRLAEELIDVASIESGQLKPNKKPVSLQSILKSVIQSYQPQAEAKQLTLDSAIDLPSPTIAADARLIKNAISSIVDNAIKFTNQGTVSLSARRSEKGIEISVSDTGPGIPQEYQFLLFQEFSKLGGSKDPFSEGHGLGLYLAKLIIESHGGSITVKSDANGSQFTILLPEK